MQGFVAIFDIINGSLFMVLRIFWLCRRFITAWTL